MDRQIIQHKRNGEIDKKPRPEDLELGEIAINYADESICTIDIEDMTVTDESGNVISLPPYVGFYNRTYSQKVDQYRIVDDEELVITETGSNKRPQFGSSSSYQGGKIFIKMKFKLNFV